MLTGGIAALALAAPGTASAQTGLGDTCEALLGGSSTVPVNLPPLLQASIDLCNNAGTTQPSPPCKTTINLSPIVRVRYALLGICFS